MEILIPIKSRDTPALPPRKGSRLAVFVFACLTVSQAAGGDNTEENHRVLVFCQHGLSQGQIVAQDVMKVFWRWRALGHSYRGERQLSSI